MVFIQNGTSLLYLGEIRMQDFNHRVHFAHDELTRSLNSVELFIDMEDSLVTLNNLLTGVFGRYNSGHIMSDLTLTRGIQDIENQAVSKVILNISRDDGSFVM